MLARRSLLPPPLYNKRTCKHQEVDSVHMDEGVGDELLGVIQVTSSVLADC